MAVRATPKDGPWKDAIYCTVYDPIKGKEYKDIPIFRKVPPPEGDAEDYSIKWTQLPILILNDISDPDNDTPIDTDQANFNEIRGANKSNPVIVHIDKDVGWPNGVIVLP